ncbi:MAG: hypothetical protein ACREXQ_05665 [Polaromonas sp.]
MSANFSHRYSMRLPAGSSFVATASARVALGLTSFVPGSVLALPPAAR